ncbi:hypothetical protein N0Y54_02680 [Nostoc punctiforme UO1]
MTFPPKKYTANFNFQSYLAFGELTDLFLSEIQYIKTNRENEHLFTKVYS